MLSKARTWGSNHALESDAKGIDDYFEEKSGVELSLPPTTVKAAANENQQVDLVNKCHAVGVAEWSACLPNGHEVVGSIPTSAETYPPFLSTKPCRLSILLNTTAKRLRSVRVVSVATLSVLVSKIG